MKIIVTSVVVWLWFRTGELAIIGEITEDMVDGVIESYGDLISDHFVEKNYRMEL